jgi:hypothetical protein
MDFPARVECLNLAGSAAEQRPLTPLWVRSARTLRMHVIEAPFLTPPFAARNLCGHRLSRHCTPLCSYFVLAQSSVNRKQKQYSPPVRSQ